ncbi:MAG TPA: hypothetical protein VKZ49_17020 [Polyangiaceae bacterium]|nr:hypothetical protein [Polyangiaceae bacterium]
MADWKAMLEAAAGYLKRNPEEVVRLVRGAAERRLSVPLDAVRWYVAGLAGKRAPKDIELVAVPPGLRLGLTVELMGTPLRVSGILYVDRVEIAADTIRVDLRLNELSLKVLDETIDTPIAALIRSGALDLSKPGNLVAYMPKRPAMLIDAKDDRVTLDLMRLPKLAKNEQIGRLLGILTPIVTVETIGTSQDHLDIVLRTFPSGLSRGFQGIRSAL